MVRRSELDLPCEKCCAAALGFFFEPSANAGLVGEGLKSAGRTVSTSSYLIVGLIFRILQNESLSVQLMYI